MFVLLREFVVVCLNGRAPLAKRFPLEGLLNVRPVGKALFAALTVSICLLGQVHPKHEPWLDKDWTEWTTQDCIQVLHWSPWVHVERRGGGYTSYVTMDVQLRSALPIRQALLRQVQLENRYDKMNAQKKRVFDQQHTADLTGATDGNILVDISNTSAWDANPYESRDNPYITQLADPLRQAALLPAGHSLVSLVMPIQTTILKNGEFENECQYVFPRTVDGKSVVTVSDSFLEVVLGAPLVIDKKTKQVVEQPFQNSGGYVFKISDLMYKGKLEY